MRTVRISALLVLLSSLVVGCAPAHETVDYAITCNYGVGDPQFTRVMGHLLGPPLVQGNQVDTFVNGDAIFPAMLEAIRGAKKTINFETYIYASDHIGRQFTDALAERAGAGVQVRIILDAVGGDGFTKADRK